MAVMDELTRERFLIDMPPRLRPPWRKPRPVDWKVIEERRRVLDEGLRKVSREDDEGQA